MKKNFTQIPNRAARNPGLSVYDFRILVCIISYDPSFPSLSLLSEISGISRAKTVDCIKKLVALRIIKKEKRGFKKNNLYRLLPESKWLLKPYKTLKR